MVCELFTQRTGDTLACGGYLTTQECDPRPLRAMAFPSVAGSQDPRTRTNNAAGRTSAHSETSRRQAYVTTVTTETRPHIQYPHHRERRSIFGICEIPEASVYSSRLVKAQKDSGHGLPARPRLQQTGAFSQLTPFRLPIS